MYQGDIAPSSILDIKFTSRSASTGVPATLSGTPAISVYKDNSTTQTTTGVTLTVDFDSVTGLNNVRIDTSADGTFYSAGSNFQLIITTGTVGGNSVVGYVVGSFSINNRTALRPTTAGRTLDVSTGGEAGIDWANVGTPSSTVSLSGTTVATVTTATATTTVNGLGSGVVTAASIAASALNGKGDWNIGKTGYSLSSAGVQAIWDALTSALTTASSIGKLLVDNVNAAISSRMATYTQPTGFLAATFPATVASTTNITAGTVTTVSGNVSGSVGSVTGAVGSVTSGVTVTTNNDKTGYGLSSAAVQAIWDALTSALTTANSIGKYLVDNIASIASNVSTVLTGTTTINSTTVAIKAKTDNLPPDPADASDIATSFSTVNSGLTAINTNVTTVSTNVTAIKAKTDLLPAAPSAMTVKRATAFGPVTLIMRDSSGNALTGLAVTATRSIDGGAFAACTNAVAELSNGAYTHTWSVADLTGAAVTFRYTAGGARDLFWEVFPESAS